MAASQFANLWLTNCPKFSPQLTIRFVASIIYLKFKMDAIGENMYLLRTLEGYISKVVALFPVLLLTGASQVAKTTLLRHLGGN
jgi:hypothetical protein